MQRTDRFAYNPGFTDAKMRIKINQIQLKETKEENKTTHERVAADRHLETQAAIVRIMKGRKVITHTNLVKEVIEATRSRGRLQPPEIKENIDKYGPLSFLPCCHAPFLYKLGAYTKNRLIDKDYMEREEGNQYRYVA